MGKLKQAIINAVLSQVKARGVVVWYDPEKQYSRWVEELQIDGVCVLRYQDGFFRLRRELEPFFEFVGEEGGLLPDAEQNPSVLVYVPLEREETAHALIEAETAGVVMEPGAAGACGTSLGHWVEKVFAEVAPPKAKHLSLQADAGHLTLEELDAMAEDAVGVATGILQVVFGQSSPEEILLQFLASDTKDAALIHKHGQEEIIGLIKAETGCAVTSVEIGEVRRGLQRFVLLSDLLLAIPVLERPTAFANLPQPATSVQREFTRRLGDFWRNRSDLKESYAAAAMTLQQEMSLEQVNWPLGSLKESQTFALLERLWLSYAAERICGGEAQQVSELAITRSKGFWARELPAFQMEWLVVEAAAVLLLESLRVKAEIKSRKWTWDDLIHAYVGHSAPWMRVDRTARQLGTRYALFESVEADEASTLEKAIAKARHHYTEAVAAMAETYAAAALDAEFDSRRHAKQTTVFRDAVKPRLSPDSRVAYFLVDALRYEMAAEFFDGLEKDFESHLSPVLGQLPGVTHVGMAALLPGAEQGMELRGKSDSVQVFVAGQAVNGRQARVNWLAERSGFSTVSYKLGEVTKIAPKRKKEIEAARLVIVTSQELDRLGEEAGDEEETRRYMDEVLDKLKRAIRSLSTVGVTDFVICADHGYLLLDAVDPGLSMDAPGGDTFELHARAWLGMGGTTGAGYFRLKAHEIDLGGPLDFAFPKGLATFKVKGGAGSYFHGGISPQEHILPLITLRAKKVRPKAEGLAIKLTMTKQKITNRLFTAVLTATGTTLFPDSARRVRVEVFAGKTEIGGVVAAAYNFAENTHEVMMVQDKPNVVTLMLQTADIPAAVTVQAVDCDTGLVLDAIKDIPVELSI